MGKDNFYKLCGELRPFIQRKVTNMARWRGLFTVPCKRFKIVLFLTRFQGNETVPNENASM